MVPSVLLSFSCSARIKGKGSVKAKLVTSSEMIRPVKPTAGNNRYFCKAGRLTHLNVVAVKLLIYFFTVFSGLYREGVRGSTFVLFGFFSGFRQHVVGIDCLGSP